MKILDFNNKRLRTENAARVAVSGNQANPLLNSGGLARIPKWLSHRIFARTSETLRLNCRGHHKRNASLLLAAESTQFFQSKITNLKSKM